MSESINKSRFFHKVIIAFLLFASANAYAVTAVDLVEEGYKIVASVNKDLVLQKGNDVFLCYVSVSSGKASDCHKMHN